MEFKIKGLTFCIKPSFIVLFIVMIALIYIEQFFMLFVSVTLHEFGHILAAKYFGLDTEKIIFTPIGEISVIKDIDTLETYKKCFIILAGPFVNIVFFIVLSFFRMDLSVFKGINVLIAVFNLAPVYPLDGGRLLQAVLGDSLGVLTANRLIIKISYFLSLVIFLAGIVQVILYSYNISLLCIGIYLLRINKKQYLMMAFEFYKSIIGKRKRLTPGRVLRIKHLLVSSESSIKNVIVKLCWGVYTVIYVHDDGYIGYTITEAQLIDYIQLNGINGTLQDVYRGERFTND